MKSRNGKYALMERFKIPNLDNPEQTYLTRWRLIQTPRFSLFLHRMDGPDSRPTLHDHPYSFVSLILRGGYVEQRLNLTDRTVSSVTRRRWNVMRRDDAHAITGLLRVPTWTLLFVGARRRTWGYWRPFGNSGRGAWYWTPFNTDLHAGEFDEAMRRRG